MCCITYCIHRFSVCKKLNKTGVVIVSLQHFVSNCGEYAVHMVDNLLDILTDCEHSKTNAVLLQVR